MWTEKGMTALQVSPGVTRRGSSSPRSWRRGEYHEETVDTWKVACPVVGARGTEMHKAQGTESRERDGHGNGHGSAT